MESKQLLVTAIGLTLILGLATVGSVSMFHVIPVVSELSGNAVDKVFIDNKTGAQVTQSHFTHLDIGIGVDGKRGMEIVIPYGPLTGFVRGLSRDQVYDLNMAARNLWS